MFALSIERVSSGGTDTTAPTLTAALLNDTGTSTTDGITSNPSIVGAVTDGGSGVASLFAGLDSTPIANFQDVSSLIGPGGSFGLNPALLNQLAGGVIGEGAHTLHLVAKDAAGNARTRDVSFTLDTIAPAEPSFDLAPTDQFGNPANHRTQSAQVTLVGAAEAGATLALASGGTTIASNLGEFQLANVELSLGGNTLTVTASDTAGNTSIHTLSVERLIAVGATNSVIAWNRITLDAIALDASAPTVASRALAMESLAVLRRDRRHQRHAGLSGEACTAPPGASAEAAVAAAAHEILDLSLSGADGDVRCANWRPRWRRIADGLGARWRASRSARRWRRASHCASGQRWVGDATSWSKRH